ncbi:unnamed protein product, partial [Meganyctiphanes norvegica]
MVVTSGPRAQSPLTVAAALSLLLQQQAHADDSYVVDNSYFPDWATVLAARQQEPTCVDIPEDMGLCSGIDYTKMRLPNLLDHETLTEVQKQANYWVPLLNLRCHPDTQLFLCSLFTPVCLEQPIYPCRSLCETVRNGCEARMRQYSYPWPDMLHCNKFPEDNDMCIAPQSGAGVMAAPAGSNDVASCNALCDPVDTMENILDHYCRADVVVKTRLKRQRKGALLGRKAKVYKAVGVGEQGRRSLRRSPRFSLESSCCSVNAGSNTKFLIMGSTQGQAVQTTFIMPFGQSRAMRKAMKMLKSLNCSDPTLLTSDSFSNDARPKKRPRGDKASPKRKLSKKPGTSTAMGGGNRDGSKRRRGSGGYRVKPRVGGEEGSSSRGSSRRRDRTRGRVRVKKPAKNKSRVLENEYPMLGDIASQQIAFNFIKLIHNIFD